MKFQYYIISLFTIASFIFIPLPRANGQTHFGITITSLDANKGIVYAMYSNSGAQHVDTLANKDGTYRLEGELNEPFVLRLRFRPAEGTSTHEETVLNRLEILIDGGEVSVRFEDKLALAVVEGACLQHAYQHYKDEINRLHQMMQPLNMAKQRLEKAFAKDSVLVYEAKLAPLYNEEEAFIRKLIKEDPDSYLSVLALRSYCRPAVLDRDLNGLYALLSADMKESTAGAVIKKIITDAGVYTVGMSVPQFSVPDTAGRLVDSEIFRGKYVLLDFWASWCGPCRAEHPFLLDVYQKFKTENFEIVSISIDTDRNKWLGAIADDQIGQWTHLSDLKGKESAVAQMLHVKAIPFNVLLSPEGKIIAKNLKGLKFEEVISTQLYR